MAVDLLKFDNKHVLVKDKYGNAFAGEADFCSAEYCSFVYGKDEACIIVTGFIIYESQIDSVEEIAVHGTTELRTENLILRRYILQDAQDLYKHLGSDPEMYKYSGWNPYATPEMAEETVRRFIEGYEDERCYSWAIDSDDADLVGTIGAYDYEDGRIEVGFSIIKECWGKGYATEALRAVLEYLTENEEISCVTAWCAEENAGSRKVLEKAGMRLIRTEKDGLEVGAVKYDKQIYEYKKGSPM